MQSRLFPIIIFLILTYSPLNICQAESNSKLINILNGINKGDSLVICGCGFLKYNEFYADTINEKATSIEIFTAFDGVKLRTDVFIVNSGGDTTLISQQAFDGNKTDNLYLMRYDRGILTQDRNMPNGVTVIYNSMRQEYDPRNSGMTLFGPPLGIEIQKALNKEGYLTDVSYIKDEIIEGTNCSLIQLSFTDSTIFKIWISPDNMYRMLKLEIINSYYKLIGKFHYKNYGNGIFFINDRELNTYTFDDKTKQYVYDWSNTMQINDDFKINPEIPASVYDIKFPSGLIIYDERVKGPVEIK